MQRINRVWLWSTLLVLALTLPALLWERHENRSAAVGPPDVPLFAPGPGHYTQDLLVELKTSAPAAAILFTTDGSTPVPGAAAVYDRAIPIDADLHGVTVLSARLQWPDGTLGRVQRASYFTLDTSLPVMSLILEPDDLTDPDTGLYTNPRQRGPEWERPVHVTYLDTGSELAFQVPAGLRVHGNNSRDYDKKSWRLYFRSEYGMNRLSYPLFDPLPNQPVNNAGWKRLVLHSGGQEFAAPGWTYLRTPLMEWLGAQTHVTVAPSRPVLLFINGQPEGIYTLRQRIDEWFFADVYGIDVPDQGAQDALWQDLWAYLETHDMRDPAAYAYVTERINVDNFIDYHVLQLYAANTDWIYANVREYLPQEAGGQWHWLFWDVDWVFGLSLGSGPDFNMMTRFFEMEDPDFVRGALPLRRLMENPDFRARFLARADELLNMVLAPERVAAQIDALAVEMRPDVAYEYTRWPSPTDWEASVAEMRRFVQERPSYFRRHVVDQFDLAGSASLALATPAAGEGRLAINDWLLPPDWRGTYFLETMVTVTAVPAPGYRFEDWVEADLPPVPVVTWPVSGAHTFTPRFAPVSGEMSQAGDVVIAGAGSSNHPDYDVNGDWVELLVRRGGGVDLRGWRITDADTKTATDEGSLFFANLDALARVPAGTRILVVNETAVSPVTRPADDLSAADGRILLYVGNGAAGGPLAVRFHLASRDSVALLAPGSSPDFADDVGIDFYPLHAGLPAVTPFSFGILQDGVENGMLEADR